jgi:hypothetical protein
MYRTLADGRTVTCVSCGIHTDAAEPFVSAQGERVCSHCAASQRVACYIAQGRRNAFCSALGALAFGVVSSLFLVLMIGMQVPSKGTVLFYVPLLLATGIAATATGLTTLTRLRAPEERSVLGRLYRSAAAVAAVGSALGCATMVFVLWALFAR